MEPRAPSTSLGTGCQGGSTHHAVRLGAQRLQAAGIPHARHEAEWLLSRLVGVLPLDVYLQEAPLEPRTADAFFSQIEERASGVPLQYLLGEAEFFGRRFLVRPGVFIPRPETEVIVDAALRILRSPLKPAWIPTRVLDAGTGSGCIAVTLACALPACLLVGVELSWDALQVARENARRHGVLSRVGLVQGDWVASLHGPFDGIVANPPYIPSDQVDRLPLDVRREPRVSLDGGADGLRDLVRLLRDVPRVLAPGGLLALECAERQVQPLARIARQSGWVQTVLPLRDLTERPRGLLVTRAP